jgi:hypothetical protein
MQEPLLFQLQQAVLYFRVFTNIERSLAISSTCINVSTILKQFLLITPRLNDNHFRILVDLDF